ncbi:hypothetical protein SPV1_05163 [Mariprofundus ferrooxydans PV-1]|uniref:Uncharacterized protein n=1 Tax=Mariprofundus ferrooxydans PV-1 TaxID=314345 RepID=Q0F2V8_9PROT|nr:hypothetical protein SPV1_05163 [Mariprofundus ferrooxydans PV-1]
MRVVPEHTETKGLKNCFGIASVCFVGVSGQEFS